MASLLREDDDGQILYRSVTILFCFFFAFHTLSLHFPAFLNHFFALPTPRKMWVKAVEGGGNLTQESKARGGVDGRNWDGNREEDERIMRAETGRLGRTVDLVTQLSITAR